jgi:hypothetical protein
MRFPCTFINDFSFVLWPLDFFLLLFRLDELDHRGFLGQGDSVLFLASFGIRGKGLMMRTIGDEDGW